MATSLSSNTLPSFSLLSESSAAMDPAAVEAHYATPAFKTLIATFEATCWQFDGSDYVLGKLYHHYKDVCSAGDTVVHLLLGVIRRIDAVEEMIKINTWAEEDLGMCCAEHITETLKTWMDRNKCVANPWWAS